MLYLVNLFVDRYHPTLYLSQFGSEYEKCAFYVASETERERNPASNCLKQNKRNN